MKKVLIDTDVILDFFFDRKPFSKDSTIILSLCEKGKIDGYITSVIISNIYYLLRKTATHERVLEKLKTLMTFLSVISMNKNVIEKALNSQFKDFEDALQNFAAVMDGEIELIITRNIKDFKKSEISVLTPIDFLNLHC